MSMRMCAKCSRAENPLARLRFKKSLVDGEVYCENCTPLTHSIDDERRSEAPAFGLTAPLLKPSAGYVVIDCPKCAGGTPRGPISNTVECFVCAGYGAVRIEAAMLNVYRPQTVNEPVVLTED